LILWPDQRAALGGLAVDPNLTYAKHLFEARAVASHRFLQYLREAFSVNLVVANARGFSRGTQQQ
jgi:hypothetical protein